MNIFGFSLGASGWAGGAVFFFFSSESAMVAVSDLARGSAQGGMADLGPDSFRTREKSCPSCGRVRQFEFGTSIFNTARLNHASWVYSRAKFSREKTHRGKTKERQAIYRLRLFSRAQAAWLASSSRSGSPPACSDAGSARFGVIPMRYVDSPRAWSPASGAPAKSKLN